MNKQHKAHKNVVTRYQRECIKIERLYFSTTLRCHTVENVYNCAYFTENVQYIRTPETFIKNVKQIFKYIWSKSFKCFGTEHENGLCDERSCFKKQYHSVSFVLAVSSVPSYYLTNVFYTRDNHKFNIISDLDL